MKGTGAVTGIGPLLRELAPQALGALVRHHGGFDACEDAVQEALLAAATRWPVDGVPDNPRGWLITVASRRRIEMWQADTARRRREETALAGLHRVDAVRAHLLELAGDREKAREHYARAARATLSLPERRYLEERARASR